MTNFEGRHEEGFRMCDVCSARTAETRPFEKSAVLGSRRGGGVSRAQERALLCLRDYRGASFVS